jgi:prepilin peptidase CpaA
VFAGSTYNLIAGVAFTAGLLAACVSDLRARRIPNKLVLLIAIVGMAFSVARWPVLPGLARGFGGFALGLLIWLPFYAVRWLGAGDVKLFAAASAWLGATAAVEAALIAALAGGLLATGWLIWERGWRTAASTVWLSTLHPRVVHRSAAVTDPRRKVPYGIAIAAGLAVAGWFPGVVLR